MGGNCILRNCAHHCFCMFGGSNRCESSSLQLHRSNHHCGFHLLSSQACILRDFVRNKGVWLIAIDYLPWKEKNFNGKERKKKFWFVYEIPHEVSVPKLIAITESLSNAECIIISEEQKRHCASPPTSIGNAIVSCTRDYTYLAVKMTAKDSVLTKLGLL